MCIIIHKPSGVSMPSQDILEECFYNNPDGAGYMLKRNNLLHMEKGFMSLKALNARLQAMNVRDTDEIAIHYRITTSGGTKPANCHPFPLSRKEEQIKDISHRLIHAGLMHNGIIGQGAKDMSDTMLFVRDVLSLPDLQTKLRKACAKTIAHISKATEGSRLLIMQAGCVETIRTGTWQEDAGIYYSNGTYKPFRYSYTCEDWEELACPSCGTIDYVEDFETVEYRKTVFCVCPTCFHTFEQSEGEQALADWETAYTWDKPEGLNENRVTLIGVKS